MNLIEREVIGQRQAREERKQRAERARRTENERTFAEGQSAEQRLRAFSI